MGSRIIWDVLIPYCEIIATVWSNEVLFAESRCKENRVEKSALSSDRLLTQSTTTIFHLDTTLLLFEVYCSLESETKPLCWATGAYCPFYRDEDAQRRSVFSYTELGMRDVIAQSIILLYLARTNESDALKELKLITNFVEVSKMLFSEISCPCVQMAGTRWQRCINLCGTLLDCGGISALNGIRCDMQIEQFCFGQIKGGKPKLYGINKRGDNSIS